MLCAGHKDDIKGVCGVCIKCFLLRFIMPLRVRRNQQTYRKDLIAKTEFFCDNRDGSKLSNANSISMRK